ncbi:MAG TPA: mechanosensitive ion channel family protein [Pseudolysinimonas sp.]|nr:mechanosensitive ion channel family protein [Pseudolysinimonas sp.]
MNIVAQSWFWPALIVIIGLPVVLLVLGELHTSMVRAGNPGARIVLITRNVLAPLGAVLILFTQIPQSGGPNAGFTWAKLVATAFGFVVILVLLGGLNLAVFVTARKGTWRNRIPSIFVEIARVLLIVVCVAVLFAWVWGADIGGFFTALGVGSIIIGLALQNAVGSLLSGLFLVFEQPFELGDYLVTPNGKGRVVVMNWRATHIDSGNGIIIIPNATLAGESFTNLSRASDTWEASTDVRFATDDPPQEVMDLMVQVASDLPDLQPDSQPSAIPIGKSWYEINIALTAPGKAYTALGTFRSRLWYAARRKGLHLDRDLTDNYATPERTKHILTRVAPYLYLTPEDVDAFQHHVKLERYGDGERVQKIGTVPDGLRIIVSGVVQLSVPGPAGAQYPIVQLKKDDLLGLTALTRQAVGANAVVIDELAALFLPVTLVDTLVKTRPALARDIGLAIDHRQGIGSKVMADVGESVQAGSLVIA